MIPRVIHYCWFGGNALPDEAVQCIKSWKQFCPTYEIKEWNENNFDIFSNTYTSEAYDAKKWAFVSDYVRLKVLNDYGGFYMDTDVEILKPLDILRQYDAFSGFESNDSIPTGIIGACAHNEWISYLLEYYKDKHFLVNGQFDLTTNVQTITRMTAEKYSVQLNNKMQYFGNNMILFPFDYLCAKNFKTGELIITKNTMTVHHFAGSWIPAKKREYSSLVKKYYSATDYIGWPTVIRLNYAKLRATYQLGGNVEIAKKLLSMIKRNIRP
jgi:hypothetical protein